mgnify:CR=1 FL=1
MPSMCSQAVAFIWPFGGIVEFIRTSLYTGLQLFRSPGEHHEDRNWFI